MAEIHIPYLPTAKFFKIRCRVGIHEQDIASDTDSDPQIRTIGGTVTIATSVKRFRYTEADGRARVVYLKPETYTIQTATGELFDADGNVGVHLLDTTSPGVDPQGWTYTATVRPEGGEPFDAVIPSGWAGEAFDLGDGLVFSPSTGITDLETRVKALEDAGGSGPGAPENFDESVQDIVGAMVTGAGGTYDDAAGTITLPAGGGGGASAITADDTPAAPAEGESASYLVTSAVSWPAGLVWSTDPDGGVAPTITGTALVSLFTVGGVTRAIMGATFPALPDTSAPVAGTLVVVPASTSALGTVTGASDAVALDPTPYSFRLDAGAWSAWQASASYTWTGLTASTAYTFQHRVIDAAGNITEGTAVTDTTDAPLVDTTDPTPGTLAASGITDTTFTLTVSGASDETELHATPYAYSTDNGTTWSAWQAGATYEATGLAAGTTYTCQHKVRDAALNEATGTAITTTTGTGGGGGTYEWARRVTPEQTDPPTESPSSNTHTYTVAGTPGRLLVAGFSADKAPGAITVSSGWSLVAYNSGSSVSGAIAWRVATGSDDITWTLGGGQSKQACCDVHEFTGFGPPTVDVFATFPNPPDDTTKTSIAVTAGNATADGIAVAIAGQDTASATDASAQTVDSGYTMRSWNTAGGGSGGSLLMATKNVSAGDSTAATFGFGLVNDQAFGAVAVFKG